MTDTHEVLKTPKSISLLGIMVLILASSFYMYEFVLQVSMGVMTGDLMRDLNIDAAGVGLVSAFYYYAYTPMQLPAGLLYDRFGPRALLTMAVTVCAVGAFLFSLAQGALPVAFGRFFMGIGSAFAFIGSLVLLTRWFPARHFAMLAGLVQLMSSVGALFGEAPLAAAVERFGWRHTIFFLGVLGLGLALLIWWVVRNGPNGNATSAQHSKDMSEDSLSELRRLKFVCKQSQTWLLGLYSFCSWAPILVFPSLWGIPFLVQMYGVSTTKASFICSMAWVGVGLGSPLIGIWSERIQRRCLPLFVASFIGFIAMMAVLYFHHLPLWVVYLGLLLIGLSAAGQSLSFALVRDNNPTATVGTAIGFNNMMVVAGGALFQPLVGLMLRFLWDGNIQNGVPVYQITSYQIAITVLPISYIVGMIISAKFLKESYCRLHQNNAS